MGDTAESNMETDVSSTTADVPDSLEETGSQSSMETVVVVVEQMKEEQLGSSDAGKVSNTVVEASDREMSSSTKSPQEDSTTHLLSLPKKSLVSSPNKELVKPKSPVQETVLATSNIIDTQKNEEQQSETVDSSNTVEFQSSSDNNDILETPLECPIKDTTNSTKDSEPVQNPVKEVKEVNSQGSIDPKVSNIAEENTIVNDKIDSSDILNKKGDVSKTQPMDVSLEIEASNDSQMDASSDVSEKEHNKSISRELKSLIKSAKESKIISECTQVTTKMRKSRTVLDTSNSSLNTSVDAEKLQGQRRNSSNSQQSNSSEKSEKVLKRSMRSQNPEFVNKVKQFLNSVTGKVQKETEAGNQIDEESSTKHTEPQNEVANIPPKMKKMTEELSQTQDGRLRRDPFCWRCHWGVEQDANDKGHSPMHCTVCPRSFHFKCLTGAERNKINTDDNWVCPECRLIMQAESSESRSPAMKKMSLGMLCELLGYALERMKDVNGVEPFTQPVDRSAFPDYDKYVVHPMDLTLIKKNLSDGHYGSTEAFHADVQWILHNSIIFNTFCPVPVQSKLTAAARALLRSCKMEMGEIEACPECYCGAHSRKPTWFIDVCSTPHILLWAKLKGFPYWPAKGMTVNNAGLVDVRFFGAHDRAWVPSKDCFLYSEKDPNNFRAKRQDIIDSMQEAEQHIRNISRKYGKFVYPPFRTQFEPSKIKEQLKIMIPSLEIDTMPSPGAKSATDSPSIIKKFRRASSKGPKLSINEGETSEKEDSMNTSQLTANDSKTLTDKTAIEATNKDKPEEEDFAVSPSTKKRRQSVPPSLTEKENLRSRKRRRSQLEEAVISIVEPSGAKRKKLEEKTEKTTEKQESKTDPPEKQKSTDSISTTIKTRTPKDSPSVKKTTVTYISKTPKINPLKIVISTKNKTARITTAKSTPDKLSQKDKAKTNGPDQKHESPKLKQKKSKSVDEGTKTPDRKSDKTSTPKHSGKGICVPVRILSKPVTPNEAKANSSKTDLNKTAEKMNDDTSLVTLARDTTRKSSSLPTISSVRSLSDTTPETSKSQSKSSTKEVIIEVPPDSSVFTPTSTDNVTTSQEAANKLQRLRAKDTEPSSLIGKVGVRAFARMTSPPAQSSDNVQVEVKSEPIDVDLDADRHNEKMDLMNAFRLRPVNPPVTNLRDVRITKILPNPSSAPKPVNKTVELRPRAKKSFPQPKKPEDGRSELISKNSMVYIPIQPPISQAPLRPQRPNAQNGPVTSTSRNTSLHTMVTPTNSLVNTVTTPLVPSSITPNLPISSASLLQSGQTLMSPSIGQVPTNVHTVPLLTTMNGQWTISLQPIMSVGGVDSTSSPPLVNGVPDRSGPTPLVPLPPSITQNFLTSNQNLMPNQSLVNNQNLIGNQNLMGNQNLVANQSVLPPSPANQSLLVANQGVLTPVRTENLGDLPRLQRPVIINPQEAPPPAAAGPVTSRITNNAVKLADMFRNLLEESIDKVDDPSATVTALKLQLEHATWRHKQEVDELKHNHDLQLAELRLTMEKEKSRAVAEARRLMQNEVDAVKTKQWCAMCKKEAQYYCCWSAAYCDEACQRAHWRTHCADCEQTQQKSKNSKEVSKEPDSRLQPKPNLSKPAAPMLTVGGKVVNQDKSSPQKAAIIMSMIEDPNGNQTVKCVGYQNVKPPVLINKQIMANDEKSKKVSSGGYLIVGSDAPIRQFY